MAALNENDGQLILNGTDVSGYATSCAINQSVGVEDTSAGFGLDHELVAGKLRSTTWDIKIAYDVADVSTFIADLRTGQTYTATWRPEGNTGGKPEHEQTILITDVKQTEVAVDKPMVMFEITARGDGEAGTDMFNGGTV